MNTQKEDKEWHYILESIGKQIAITDDYLDVYLQTMAELIGDYWEHPYRENQTEENKKSIEHLLLDIGSLFYCFDIHMKRYNDYAYKHDMQEYPFEWVKRGLGIKGSHNYNSFLVKLNKTMLIEYYDKCITEFEEWIKRKAKTLPNNMYTITYINSRKQFTVMKLELVRDIGIYGDILCKLPDYYPMHEGNYKKTKEEYKPLFNNETSYERFIKYEWPIYEWIQKNRILEPLPSFDF
ncbi:hypothetical protein [Enterocloster citroniae]